MFHYFAYGSNMNPDRVRERGLDVVSERAAQLQHYRLTFNKMSRDHAGHGHANIEYARGAVTEGVLYELRGPAEILKMDPYERAPWNYGRDAVEVDILAPGQGGGRESGRKSSQSSEQRIKQWAWTYFANPAVHVINLAPTAEYLAHLLAGEAYLSDAYLQHLRSWAPDEDQR